MSGATVAYNLRQNKHVERQLFAGLITLFERWMSVRNHLYVGFGGVYFEDYKLLHNLFGIDKMISLEQEQWMLPRQNHNVPFECVEPRFQTSTEFIREIDEHRTSYNVDNLVIWLDYADPRELATYLNEARALVPKLIPGDMLKVTLSLHTKWLEGSCKYHHRFQKRLESLRAKLGSAYLPDGLTIASVKDDKLPDLYLGALRRAIAEGMSETPDFEFLPLGCYSYSDGTQMLTMTGVIVERTEAVEFASRTRLEDFEFGSPDWGIHLIKVPDLSLRERLELDRSLYTRQPGMPAATCDVPEISGKLGFQLDKSMPTSEQLIERYMKLYRFYPNYHRVHL